MTLTAPGASGTAGDAPGTVPNYWAVQAAVAASLAALLADHPAGLVQLGLFGFVVALNAGLVGRFFPTAPKLPRIVWYLISAPIFLLLTDSKRMSGEWLIVRIIDYFLIGGLYLLPFLSFPSAKELRRMTVLLVSGFFFSATYLRSTGFFPALIVAALSLCIAFHSIRPHHAAAVGAGRLFRRAAFQLIVASLCALVVFCSFPRNWFRAPRHGGRYRGRDQVSQTTLGSQQQYEAGMSARRDLLELAHLVDFSRSGTELLRIRMTMERTGLPFYATNSLYLRASTFETYADGHWTSYQSSFMHRDSEDGTRDNWTWIKKPAAKTNRLRVRQRIQTEPLEDVCFCLPEPVAINQARIRTDGRGVLVFPSKTLHSLNYEVISELPPALNLSELDDAARERIPAELTPYLKIPPTLRPQLNNIVGRWNPARGRASQIEQLCQLLRGEFEYGASPFLPAEGVDPVSYFLTVSRQGYCTHFASALALLARAIGLPSRVATGLHFTGLPDEEGVYHLRDLNAHAWTEVYFPGHDWVIFDATPAAARPASEAPAEVSRWWRGLWKLGRVDELLDEFGVADQKAFLKAFGEAVLASLNWWRATFSAPGVWLGLIVVGVLGWGGLRQLPLRQRRRLLQRVAGQSAASSVPFYEDMLWILSRHGLRKPAALTGLEYGQWLLRRCPFEEVSHLTHQFYQVKYGAKVLSPNEQAEIERQLQHLEAAFKSANHRPGKSP
jgi:hypothetical protein